MSINKDSGSPIPQEILDSIDKKNKIDEDNVHHIRRVNSWDLYMSFASRSIPTLFGYLKLIFVACIFGKIIELYVFRDKFIDLEETIIVNTLGIFREKITSSNNYELFIICATIVLIYLIKCFNKK